MKPKAFQAAAEDDAVHRTPKPLPATPTTTANNAYTTPQKPARAAATNTNSPSLQTPAPQDNQWLQIYSPNRTPIAGRFLESEFKLSDKILGSGSFARVVLANHVPTGKKVAVKIMDKTKLPENMRMYVAREPGILCNMKHPNIVKMLHSSETDAEISVFMQFFEGSDLFSYIQEKKWVDEAAGKRMFVQLLDALAHVHAAGYCHRDIKLENVLISKTSRSGTRRLVMIDFGFAAPIPSPDHKFTDHPGSVCYAAPELLRGLPYDGTKVDIYALGVTLYTILHGYHPFSSPDQRELYRKIYHQQPQFVDELSDDCTNLLMSMLDKDSAKRPSCEQIRAHPFMKDTHNIYLIEPPTQRFSPAISRLKTDIVKRLSPKTARRRLDLQ